MNRLVVVGSGIVGLAHALAAHEAGWAVTVLERTARPLGASVRNFGLLWPIGQPRGRLREQALCSVRRWNDLSAHAGFWFAPTGSLHLAYFEEGWNVLNEYQATAINGEGLELMTPAQVRERFPQVCRKGLRGALFSPKEAAVRPAEAIRCLAEWLREQGVAFHFHTPVVAVTDHRVHTSEGRPYDFDRLVVCSGDEVNLLYPEALRRAGGLRCKLQMMRTAPQPASWYLATTVVADLTLRHYASFAACPSLDALRQRVQETMPRYDDWGIHVIAAQKPDGSLILGDSHQYGDVFTPGSRMDIDAAVLRYLQSFLQVPDLSITHRWAGSYLKAPNGETAMMLNPEPDVQVITGLGGSGMTLSFALAKENVAAW